MSLINEMLKDLQQQKEGGAKQKSSLKPRRMDRIPFLPLPVVLAGGGVLLLVFIWWMAGVLSDVIFDDETAKPVAQIAQPQEPAKAVIAEPAEEETLTEEERAAEPPAVVEPEISKSSGDVEPVSAPAPAPEKVAPQPIKERQRVVDEMPAVVAKKTSVKKSRVTQTRSIARPEATKTSAKNASPKAPVKAASSAPQRLHPDQLPGAVQTPVRKTTVAEPLTPRPTRIPANTPFGMAEEAFLDGQWALSHQRSNLAVQSLQHALDLYPGHLQARLLLVDLMKQKGKSGEAMFLLAEGLKIAPDYMPFKKSYVKLLSEQGDYEAAIEVMLQGGMPAVDQDPEAHVLLATLYQSLGEAFLTAQTYRNLLVAWPQTGAFWVGLGSALEKQKLPGDAVKCYQKALETNNLRADLKGFARKRLRLLN